LLSYLPYPLKFFKHGRRKNGGNPLHLHHVRQ
jgi:hypothetical protein